MLAHSPLAGLLLGSSAPDQYNIRKHMVEEAAHIIVARKQTERKESVP